VPLEKIGDTSNFSLASLYNGIYVTAGATRFTVFAGAFGTATSGYIILTALVKFLNREWHCWFVLVLDVLNWIFMLVSWATLSAALNSTFNALLFCDNISNITNAYIASTPIPLQSVVSYLNGLKLGCRCTYAGIAFGVCAWLLFFVSIFLTGRLIFKSDETAPAELEIPTRGTVERKEAPVEPGAAPGPEHDNAPTQRTGAY